MTIASHALIHAISLHALPVHLLFLELRRLFLTVLVKYRGRVFTTALIVATVLLLLLLLHLNQIELVGVVGRQSAPLSIAEGGC